jgi:hypothetical protein
MDISIGHGWSCSKSCLSCTFNHACFAPPKSCLLCTSNVMLVVHFQYHALFMHFQCCVCFSLCNIMHVLHLQFHVCFGFAMLQLLHTFQRMFLLHFQCVAHFMKFRIKLWYSTMMNDRKFGLCLESLFIIVSPLKVIMFNNISGTLRNVHFNNREWWWWWWWRLLRKFTLVICVEKKHDQVKWICVADSWMLQEYFYWA